MTATIPGWDNFALEDRDIVHTVFVKGAGFGVVLTHELPGLTPQCIALGNRLVDAGYRVFMPLLFGRPNDHLLARNFFRLCISREFSIFRDGRTSPIVDWLRALCRHAHAECKGPGVGMIGMCITGNFAIILLAEPSVFAPIACQPSQPVGLSNSACQLAMSADDLAAVKARAESEHIPLLGFRFEGDRLCRPEKFLRLSAELGKHFRGTTLPGSGHGVLTEDFIDREGHPTRQAWEATLAFLRERLGG